MQPCVVQYNNCLMVNMRIVWGADMGKWETFQ